jgi:hypothetical protein
MRQYVQQMEAEIYKQRNVCIRMWNRPLLFVSAVELGRK